MATHSMIRSSNSKLINVRLDGKDKGSLLLVLPIPFYSMQGKWYLENQAFNGMNLWADNFSSIVLAAPVLPDFMLRFDSSIVWRPVEELRHRHRIEMHMLPWGYNILEFLKVYRSTRHKLSTLISKSHYLNFAISGLIGDWATIACLEAIRQKRRYSIWTDNVGSQHIRRQILKGSGLRRIKASLTWLPAQWIERYVIRRCALGLFHGCDTYDAYASYCIEAHIVHDIHLKKEDIITNEDLEIKKKDSGNFPLRICYVGRAIEIKGPEDWLNVIKVLHTKKIHLEAIWLGDGPCLELMRRMVSELGLESVVHLPGFVQDRKRILATLRKSHLMLFCHKTPESPRCLIEALMSGCPIVGFRSRYAEDLVVERGGGRFVDINNINALASAVIELNDDRQELTKLIGQAAEAGKKYCDEKVFYHRSELIKKYLS